MLIGGVVDDEIHHQLDAAFMQPGEQLLPVAQGAEFIHNILIIADVVPVVVIRRFIDRRQPDHIDA
ncbi:hypothetical protein D3C74_445440 [compost metagenome]